MKIGVYVGSFNPVHKGHIQTARYLLEKNILDRVILIPTLDYWNKKGLVKLPHRVAMLRFYENERIIVDNSKSHLPYTYEIMKEIKKEHPNDDIILIIGADNIKNFHKWEKVDEILKNYVMIIPRDGININDFLNNYEKKNKFIVVNDFKSVDISSTLIRKNIKDKNFKKVKDLIDDDVLNYIIQNNLYKGEK